MSTTDKLKKAPQLLPCPFCGDEGEKGIQAVTLMNAERTSFKRVSCRCCGATCPEPNWNHRAALAQQDAQAVPQGWKLVPVEPTEAMCEEGLEDEGHTIRDGKAFAGALYRAMLNAAPTPPAPKPLGWLDRKAVECLQGPELNWMPAWSRPTSSDPVPIFLSPKARATLTASEILSMMPESIPAEHDGALLEYARAVIEAYERKNGISQPGYTAPDMASQGASQFRAGHDAAQSEIAELEQENRLLRARNDRLQKEIEQKGER